MKNKDLIEKLKTFPEDMEVCIYDYLRNVKEYDGEPSGAGIYKDFDVSLMNDDEDEKKELQESGIDISAFIVIGFKNDYIDVEDEDAGNL